MRFHGIWHPRLALWSGFVSDMTKGEDYFLECTFNQVISDDPTLSFLRPIATCLRIHLEWLPLPPIFCLRPTPAPKRRCFLSDLKATVALRALPTHLYCIILKDIHSYSIRVYACLALLVAANFKDHEIEYKLRWVSKAWRVYLRENLAGPVTREVKCYNSIREAKL